MLINYNLAKKEEIERFVLKSIGNLTNKGFRTKILFYFEWVRSSRTLTLC